MVKRMSSIIESDKFKNHVLHFDNFFTSYSLLVDLAGKNLKVIGTVRSNSTESCFFGVLSVLPTIAKVTERSSLFSGKIIPLLQLVLTLAKSHQSIKSQDGWNQKEKFLSTNQNLFLSTTKIWVAYISLTCC